MWHGWPARAGAGSPPGSENAPQDAGCSSWTHMPSECPGSQWCSLLPPIGRANDIYQLSFWAWGSTLQATNLKCMHNIWTVILTYQFNTISVLWASEESTDRKKNLIYFFSHTVLYSLRVNFPSPGHAAVCRKEIEEGAFSVIPRYTRWDEGSLVGVRTEQEGRMSQTIF